MASYRVNLKKLKRKKGIVYHQLNPAEIRQGNVKENEGKKDRL